MPEPDPRLTGAPQPEPRPVGAAGPEPRPVGAAGPETVPWLIRGYLAALAARLPASVTEELADGLTETYRFYVSSGQGAEEAAASAVGEFGPSETIVADFAQVNPARRAARRLLRIGPVVGACWVAALFTGRPGRSWAGWMASAPAWAVAGVVLAGLIGLLAVAALGRQYRLATATGVAGCFGFATLDLALIVAAIFVLAPLGWVTVLAMTASATRVAVTARALRPALIR